MIDVKDLRSRIESSSGQGAAHLWIENGEMSELLNELEIYKHELDLYKKDDLMAWNRLNRERSEERTLFLAVLKEAREAIHLEDDALRRGFLKLGMWTPLNGLREVLPACSDIKTP